MSRRALRDLIVQLDQAMEVAGHGTDLYMNLWREQARAKCEIVKLDRKNQLQAWAFELSLNRRGR